jgi:hypothetical protein
MPATRQNWRTTRKNVELNGNFETETTRKKAKLGRETESGTQGDKRQKNEKIYGTDYVSS